MQDLLVITALGEDRPGLVNGLAGAIAEAGADIVDSRMAILGGEFAIIQTVAGPWNALAKLETVLPQVGNELGLHVHWKRTRPPKGRGEALPYSVEVIAMDNPGIVHRLAEFFAARSINIRDLSTTRYAAAHTGTPMFAAHMTVDIPSRLQIGAVRDEFLECCDQLNLDAVFEPAKH